MKWQIVFLAALAFLPTACWDMDPVTAAPNPSRVTPSRPPPIFSPTPILVSPTAAGLASATSSPSPAITAALTFTHGALPTHTATPTESPTPTFTLTGAPEPLTLQLLGCDTGFDITRQMGEVTNAYVAIVNASVPDLTGVCATLSSADEGRIHPDKTVCIPSLPRGHQVTLKLTIDTTFRVNTIVNVAVTSNEGILASTGRLACRDIGAFKPAPETIGMVRPIP